MSTNWTKEALLLAEAIKKIPPFECRDFSKNNDNSGNSSYSNYLDGYHMEETILEYKVSSPVELKKALDMLWKNKQDDCYQEITRVSMHAFQFGDDSVGRRLSPVKTYNYTI